MENEPKKKKYSSPKATYSSNNKFDLSRGFEKKQSTRNWRFAGWGAVATLILAIFLFVVANAKIMDKPFLGFGYWLEILENVPVVDLSKMFTYIKPVDFPDWFVLSEVLVNFIINICNLFIGSVAVLHNVLEVIRYFIHHFVLYVAV